MTTPDEDYEREAKRLPEVVERPQGDAHARSWKLGPLAAGVGCAVGATVLLAIPLVLAWLTWRFLTGR